jgi:hypothetical protein
VRPDQSHREAPPPEAPRLRAITEPDEREGVARALRELIIIGV